MTKGIAQLGLVDRAAEAHEGPRAALHAGQGDRRRLVDQRAALHARQCRATTMPGRRRTAAPAGAIATCCPISSAPRTTSASPTTTTAMAGRSACRMPISPLPICEAYFRAGQELGIPYNPDFNGAQQEGVGYYQLTAAQRAGAPRPRSPISSPIRDRKNLTVRTGALVTRDRGREGPRRRRRDRRRPAARRQSCAPSARCIVSSGAIGSPKLLHAVRHRPGRSSEIGRRHAGARPARRRLQPAGPSRPVRHRRMHRRPHL